MQTRKPRLRYLALLLTIGLMLGGVALAASIQNSLGLVIVTEVDFQAADGSNIHSTLQRPTYATSSNPLPGVVVYHGVLQNKEWLMAFGIELARRGFVVLTPDANGHGNSDSGSGSGLASLEYMASLEYVDSASIGVIGHSMGGGILGSAIEQASIDVRAVVLVGSWVGNTWNTSFPRNLLVTVGDFDSFFSGRNLTSLEDAFGTTDIQEYVTYGDFASGSARRYVTARTNHLFETIDPEIVSQTVEWMKNSLKGGIEDAHWIPSSSLVYSWWVFGGFFATLGAILTVFPLITILLEFSLFQSLKQDPSTEYSADRRTLLKWGMIFGVISPITFYPLLGIGGFIPFPQSYGAAIILWFIGTSIIFYLLLRMVSKTKGINLSVLWKIDSNQQNRKTALFRTFLLSLIVILWLYAWTLLVDLGFALDLRSFLPGMNDLTVSRVFFVPIYAIPIFIYSFVEGLWLMGPLRPSDSKPWYKGQLKWSMIAIFLKCYPFVILIALELGVGMLLGTAIFPGMIGFSFLFFYAFTPWFAVAIVIMVWSYRSTNRLYLGAMINALLFAWIIATILSLSSGIMVF
ncbi:MAG: dienelactone hydrolase family protein [Candidatus Thorarchaeota archaeon]